MNTDDLLDNQQSLHPHYGHSFETRRDYQAANLLAKIIFTSAIFPAAVIFSRHLPSLAVIIVAAAVTAVIVWRNDRLAFVALVSALGCSGSVYGFAAISLLPEHLVTGIIVFKILATGIGRRPLIALPIRLSIFFILSWLVVAASSSVFFANSPVASLRIFGWLLIALTGAWCVFRLRPSPWLMATDASIAVSVYAAVCVVGWAIALPSDEASIFVERDYASSFLRAQGLTLEPNILASYLCCMLAVTIAFGTKISNRYIWLQMVTSSVLIFATLTRAAIPILAIFFLLIVMLTCGTFAKWCATSITLLLTLVIGCGLWAPPATSVSADSPFLFAISERINDFSFTSSGTGALRERVARQALQEVGDASDAVAIMGHGVNAYPQTHFTRQSSNGQEYLASWWVALLYDEGALGLMLFIAALALLLIGLKYRGLPLALAFVVLAATTNPIWYGYFWIAAALISASVRSKGITRDSSTSGARA